MTNPASSASPLLILGAGGHGRVVADAAVQQGTWRGLRATDRNPARCTGELLTGIAMVPIDAERLPFEAVHVAIGDGAARERESAALDAARLTTVVHPAASVSDYAQVGPGCFIAAQAVVAAGARLGAGVIVNHGAVVDHDCAVGSFSHIAPRAAIGGAAAVGHNVLIGAGATVLPGIKVCDQVVVGAGAVVHRDIVQAGVYAGVPARRIK